MADLSLLMLPRRGLSALEYSIVRIEMLFSIAHSAAPREIIRQANSDVLVLIARI
jgi:hypothetical protein